MALAPGLTGTATNSVAVTPGLTVEPDTTIARTNDSSADAVAVTRYALQAGLTTLE